MQAEHAKLPMVYHHHHRCALRCAALEAQLAAVWAAQRLLYRFADLCSRQRRLRFWMGCSKLLHNSQSSCSKNKIVLKHVNLAHNLLFVVCRRFLVARAFGRAARLALQHLSPVLGRLCPHYALRPFLGRFARAAEHAHSRAFPVLRCLVQCE